MITFDRFTNYGRTGNILFQLCSMIGIAKSTGHELVLPHWEDSKYFTGEFPHGELSGELEQIQEPTFTHLPVTLEPDKNYNFLGYYQSEKYWLNYKGAILQLLTFREDFIYQVKEPFKEAFTKPTIAISIRRGDYVDNKNYELLPIHYYISALEQFDWRNSNLIIFSDDIPYCKAHFDCLQNVYFSENNSAIEDLCLMHLCDNFIVANSTFSWWGAYLSRSKNKRVIRPVEYFKGSMKEANPITDFYPTDWIEWNWRDANGQLKRISLNDCTFTIPVQYDHHDRRKNLDLCICMLQHHFDTKIIVMENRTREFGYMSQHCQYLTSDHEHFHRTRMLNDMALRAGTPIISNWDADIVLAPLQILETVRKIREGAAMVFPYDGRFARIPRLTWFRHLEQRMDIGIVGTTRFNGMNSNDAVSVGGAVFFDKAAFIAGGMENEKFISFGPADVERHIRFKTLGFKIERVPGPLYHINHYIGPDSSNRHIHVQTNRAEYYKIDAMTRPELEAYVKTWPWVRLT